MPKAANDEAEKPNVVKVRILPRGDGKVYTGDYDQITNSFPKHKKGDVIDLHPAIAEEQEEAGHVEILSA